MNSHRLTMQLESYSVGLFQPPISPLTTLDISVFREYVRKSFEHNQGNVESRVNMKVISLHPATTDIVFALGAGNLLVGRSHRCVNPTDLADLPIVTSPIDETVDAEMLGQLAPDLVLGYDLDPDACDAVAGFRLEVFSPQTLEDIWEMIRNIGALLSVEKAAEDLVRTMKERIHEMSRGITLAAESKPSVVVLRDLAPPASAGLWVPTLVRLAGGELLPKETQLTGFDILIESNPEILIIAVPGKKLKESPGIASWLKDIPGFLKLRAARMGRVFVVEGNRYFYRPGPAVVDSLELLAELLHPGLFPVQHKERGWVRADI